MLFLLKITQLATQPNHYTATGPNPNTNCSMRNQFQFLLFFGFMSYTGDFPQADYTRHWRIHEGSQGCTPPLSPISFIFMPFSAKILTNNKKINFCPKFRSWRPLPRLGNPGSTTAGKSYLYENK